MPATIVHPRDRPNAGPMKPIGMVKYWKLPRNHSGAWCQTFAVPLVIRDPIDRARLDPVDALPLRAYRRLVLE